MLNKPCSPLKCLPWLNSYRYHTKLYGRLWNILAATACWLISVCRFCLWGIRRWKSHVWWFWGMNELVNLLQRCWVGETGQVPWPERSCEFTLLNSVFWDYVTENIYILPFGILLIERYTEIEHVLRPAHFWDFTQYKLIPFWHFGITSRSHLKVSRCRRRTCLQSRQPARSRCRLEELIVTVLIYS
jgi:hypothetical protein